MVNIDDFIKRLEKILEYYNLSASSFADKIGVQRSSLSHLLSGRNKPSLDFILKLQEVFPEVDLYWILNGQGEFPKENETEPPAPFSAPSATLAQQSSQDLFSSIPSSNSNEKAPQAIANSIADASDIEKIVIFYKDGTFKVYAPK